MSRSFLDHLRANNSAGLDAVWSRTLPADLPSLVTALDEGASESETQVFLRALVDDGQALSERLRLLRVGIEALSDLASSRSSDRRRRLSRWAADPTVREALLTTAAVRGPAASEDLVEWLLSADDDALLDALIPIFLEAVERRDGRRLQALADASTRTPRLAPMAARLEALRAQSRDEWREYVAALGLEQQPPFTATCTLRVSEPAIVLFIDPRRLNWFVLSWGAATYDSTRRGSAGLPFTERPPLEGLPPVLHAAMRACALSGRRAVVTSGAEQVSARLSAWLAPAAPANERPGPTP